MSPTLEPDPTRGIPASFQPDLNAKTMPRQCHEFTLPQSMAAHLWPVVEDREVHQEYALTAALRLLHFRYSGIEDAYISISPKNSGPSPVLVSLPVDSSMPLHQVVEMVGMATKSAEMKKDFMVHDDGPTELLVEFVGDEGRNRITQSFDMVWRFSGEATCEVVYNTVLYSVDAIRALSVNFVDVLEAVFNTPHIPVVDIEFPHALDQLRQLQIPLKRSWPLLVPNSLTSAFQQVVEQYGSQIALVQQSLVFTYQDVDILSSILADRLMAQRNSSESVSGTVAFCIPQSALAIIAIIAIVKTGCAYLPLDVRDPPGRLHSLLAESRAGLLVATDDSPACLFQDDLQASLVNITGFLKTWKDLVSGPRPSKVMHSRSEAEVACLLYTSGSTGKPKGVRLMHRNILALVSNKEALPLAPGNKVAQVNNLAWDSHIIDIWGTLLSGATLFCFSRFDVLDPIRLTALFNIAEIDTCVFPTAVFRHILSVSPQLFETLRFMMLGGEAARYELIHEAKAINPRLTVSNGYGPTETCTCVTAFTVGAECPSKGPVPIGTPLTTTEVRVVDPRGRLVPPSAVGELYIGGGGVADGYHDRPEETSRAFTKVKMDGVDTTPSVFYHSGDRVKWRFDGQLEFIGRLNSGQIKIRGQRLELSEVEATVVRTTGVKDAAIVPHKFDDSKDAVLVAYVVPHQESTQVNNLERNAAIVDTWATYYDEAYSDNVVKLRQDFIGWDSMITGQPIPQKEMKNWLKDTLRPFFDCHPQTVFEVGCGIGIILYEMLPYVKHFYAIEPSAAGTERLEAQLRQDGVLDKTSLWTASADKVHTIPDFKAEFILVNSVVQYFPSEDYLRDSLLQLVDRCTAGGRIMIGDVRSASLDDFLAVDIFMERWKRDLSTRTIRDLKGHIAERRQYRTELLIDPDFFLDLKLQESRITHVEIIPKVIQHSNELSRYRYQAVLHVLGDKPTVSPDVWVSADEYDPGFESLPQLLDDFVQSSKPLLAIERIPNKLLKWESELVQTISAPSIEESATLDTLPAPDTKYKGWSAFDLTELAESYGLSVQLSSARQAEDTVLDAVFLKESKLLSSLISFKLTTSNSLSNLRSHQIRQITREPKRLHDINFYDSTETMKANLPTYMVPDALYALDYLPLTANGKLDRRKLAEMAALDYQRGFSQKLGMMSDIPQNETERIVCELFTEILSKSCNSRSADFFEQGGHSLLATRLRAALERQFDIQFPLQDIFRKATPEKIALEIQELQPTAHAVAKLEKQELPDELSDLSFAQGRLWFLNQLTPEGSEYNSPYILRLTGDVNEYALRKTVNEMVSRHDILRTVFIEYDGVPKSKVTEIIPRLENVTLDANLSEETVNSIIADYVLRPFDLSSEPAFKPVLFRWGQQRILGLMMHHIITDGQSYGVIRTDLQAIYPAVLEGKPHALPELPIRYQDYARWQNTSEFARLVEPQEEYWLSHLRGSKPARFPVDYERTSASENEAGSLNLSCDAELKDKLWALCQREHVTWFMLVLAVFRAVHFQWTGSMDASFGSAIANRHKAEVEEMLGFFVNTQVFRMKVNQGQTFTDMLRKTRELALNAFQNQDVPFDRLVQALKPSRNGFQNPLVEIGVAFQTMDMSSFALPGCDATWFHLDVQTTRFDLEAHWSETPDELRCVFLYRTAVFKHSTIAKLADDLKDMMRRVADNPDIETYSDKFDLNQESDDKMVGGTAAAHIFDETVLEPDGPPQTETEENICMVFKKILGKPTISRQSNFFNHGGHSLLVTRASSLLKQTYNLPIEIADVFEFPTPVALAKYIERLCSKQDEEGSSGDWCLVNGSTHKSFASSNESSDYERPTANGGVSHTNGDDTPENSLTNGAQALSPENGHRIHNLSPTNGTQEPTPIAELTIKESQQENGVQSPSPSDNLSSKGSSFSKRSDNAIPSYYSFPITPGLPFVFCIPGASGVGASYSTLYTTSQGFNIIGMNDPVLNNPSFADISSTWTLSKKAEVYYQQVLQAERELYAHEKRNIPTSINVLGFSLGGNLALEISRNALKDGRKVNLFTIDSAIPELFDGVEETGLEMANGPIEKTIKVATEMEFQQSLRMVAHSTDRLRDTIRTCIEQNIWSYYRHSTTVETYPGHITCFRGETNLERGLEAASVDEVLLSGNHFDLMRVHAGVIASKIDEVISLE